MSGHSCRLCGSIRGETFLDLGSLPLANSLLKAPLNGVDEPRYPLRVWVCGDCFLVQLESIVPPASIFSHYVYFSSFSRAWMAHCAHYVERVHDRLSLTSASRVVEVGSNDGHLLRMFLRHKIPVLGVEPAANLAEAARRHGVPTEAAFFNSEIAARIRERFPADLIIANNVFAHAPDINDFVRGMAMLLKPGGTITIEVPHILRMIEERQVDTIYHEHVFYFSLHSLEAALSRHGLSVYDLELLPTHGGSLRVYAAHRADRRSASQSVSLIHQAERDGGLQAFAAYRQFAASVAEVKPDLAAFLAAAARDGKRVAGYGAAAKGISLLNYIDGAQAVEYVVDLSPHKQGLFLPGTHLPIYSPERVFETRPDYLLILAWNIKDEVMEQMSGIRSWGGRFVIPAPELVIAP